MELTYTIGTVVECAACGERIDVSATVVADPTSPPKAGAEFSLLENHALSEALFDLKWEYLDEEDASEIGWVCPGCVDALERRPGGRGA
jgi:hypothetical protein